MSDPFRPRADRFRGFDQPSLPPEQPEAPEPAPAQQINIQPDDRDLDVVAQTEQWKINEDKRKAYEAEVRAAKQRREGDEIDTATWEKTGNELRGRAGREARRQASQAKRDDALIADSEISLRQNELNRQKEQQRIEAAQAKKVREQQAQQTRQHQAEGGATEIDPETGSRVISRHEDGGRKFTPGEVEGSEPILVPNAAEETKSIPIVGDFMMDKNKPMEGQQMMQDDRGNKQLRPVEEKVDSETGETFVPTTDEFGQPSRLVTGVTPTFEIDKKMDRIGLEMQQLELRESEIGPRFKQIESKYNEQIKKRNVSPPFTNVDGKWIKSTGGDIPSDPAKRKQWLRGQIPADPIKLKQWQRERQLGEPEYRSAVTRYEQEKPQWESLQERKRQIQLENDRLKIEKTRLERGLPENDAGTAKTLNAAASGQASPSDQIVSEHVAPPADPAMLRPDGTQKGDGFLGPIDLPDGSVASEYSVQSDAVKVDGQRVDFPTLVPTLTEEEVEMMRTDIIPNGKEIPEPIMRKAIAHAKGRITNGESVFADEATVEPLIPDRSIDKDVLEKSFIGLQNAKDLSIKRYPEIESFAHIMDKDGLSIGQIDVDRETGISQIVLRKGLTLEKNVQDVITAGELGGNPVYLTDNPDRPTPTQESEFVAEAFNKAITITDEDARAQALTDIGATPGELVSKVNNGLLSYQKGEALLQDLYGGSMKMEKAGKQDAQRWLKEEASPEIQKQWRQAKSTDDKNAVLSSYVDQWTIKNSWKPGFTMDQRLDLEKSLNIPSTTGEKAGKVAKMGAEFITSTVGIAAQVAAAPAVLSLAAGGHEDSQKWATAIGRGWTNTNRGWERFAKLHATDEGKKMLNKRTANIAELILLVKSQHTFEGGTKSEEFQAKLQETVKNLTDNADQIHGIRQEQGWKMERSDIDPYTNPDLKGMLDLYVATGNKDYLDAFTKGQLIDKGTQQLNKYMGDVTKGKGTIESAYLTAFHAPPQEVALEVASAVLSGGTAKLLYGSAKAMKGAKMANHLNKMNKLASSGSRVAKARLAMHGLADDYAKWGLKADTLASPASRMGKLQNQAVKGIKFGVGAAPGEFVQEAAMGASDPNATPGSAFKDGLIGAAFAPLVGGAIGGPTVAVSRARAGLAVRKETAKFASEYNKKFAGTEGFKPLTVEQAQTAMVLYEGAAETQANRLMEAESGVLEAAEAAGKEDAGPQEFQQLSAAEAHRREVTDEITDSVMSQMEAVQMAESVDPADRPLAYAITKVVNGRPDLLTKEERQAAAGALTPEGAPIFAADPVTGQDTLTDEGRVHSVMQFPTLGMLMQTKASEQLILEQTAQLQQQAAVPAEAAPQAAEAAAPQPAPEPTPEQTAEAQTKASPGKPLVEAPGRAPITPELEAQARDAATQIFAKVAAINPAIAAKLKRVDPKAKRSGGVMALSDGTGQSTIGLSIEDIATEIATGKSPEKVIADNVDFAVLHETIHTIQFDSLDQKAAKGEGKGAQEYYSEMHTQMESESPQLLKNARTLYAEQEGGNAESWDNFEGWQKAAETVRMLVEAKVAGRTTDVNRLLEDAPQSLLNKLAEAVKQILDAIKTGTMPESVAKHVDEISDLYNQLTNAETTTESTGREAGQQEQRGAEESAGDSTPAQSDSNQTADQAGAEAPRSEDAGASSQPSDARLKAAENTRPVLDKMLEAYPLLKKDPELLDGLRVAFMEVGEQSQNLPANEQVEQARRALGAYIQSDATQERLTELAKEESAKQQEYRRKAQERISQAADQAMATQMPTIERLLADHGRLEGPPNVIGLIRSKAKAAKTDPSIKLTENEQAIWDQFSSGDYDGMPTPGDFPGRGKNAVARAILARVFAPFGEGTAPNIHASAMEANWAGSDLLEAISKELRTYVNNESIEVNLADPDADISGMSEDQLQKGIQEAEREAMTAEWAMRTGINNLSPARARHIDEAYNKLVDEQGEPDGDFETDALQSEAVDIGTANWQAEQEARMPKTSAQEAPLNNRVKEMTETREDDMLSQEAPIDPAPLQKVQNNLPRVTKVTQTRMVKKALTLASRIIPFFQGNKLKMTGPTISAAEKYWTQQQRDNVRVVHDTFGGGGAWGIVVGDSLFPNLEQININEFDTTRAVKIREQVENGDRFAEEIDSPAAKRLLQSMIEAHRRRPAVQRKLERAEAERQQGQIIEGGEQLSDAEIVEASEAWSWGVINKTAAEMANSLQDSDTLKAILKTMADDPERSGPWFKRDKNAEPTVEDIAGWFKERHAPKAAAIKAKADEMKARGVKFNFTEGDAYDLAIEAGDHVMVLADPPYFATTGYAEDNVKSVVGADIYQQSANMMDRLASNNNNVLYTDEAWWLRENIDPAIRPSDLVEGQRLTEDIGNTLDLTVVADKIDSRYETLGLFNPNGSPLSPNRPASRSSNRSSDTGGQSDPAGDSGSGRPAAQPIPPAADGEAGLQDAEADDFDGDTPSWLMSPAGPSRMTYTYSTQTHLGQTKHIVTVTEPYSNPVESTFDTKAEAQAFMDELEDQLVEVKDADKVAAEWLRRIRADEPVDGDITLFSAPATFYSGLAQTLEAKMPNAAPVEQVMSIAKQGAKAEEIKWTNLDEKAKELAAANKGKVPKLDLLRWVNGEGMVKLEEVTLGDQGARDRGDGLPELDDLPQEVQNAFANHRGDDFQGLQDELRELGWTVERGMDGEIDTLQPTASQDSANFMASKYGEYTLPGGENYREIVLTMPQPTPESLYRIEPANEGFQVIHHTGRKMFRDGMEAKTRAEAEEAVENFSEGGERVGDTPAEQSLYTSSHFENVPNYVAHMRVNERQGGLFIEELQSDRHQTGRARGYRSIDGKEDSSGWTAAEHKLIPGAYEVRGKDGKFISSENADSAEEAIEKSRRNVEDLRLRTGIADAPHRKDWHIAMFKRALAQAVADGKEWIGWTTGQTQADRYDLSKKIKQIEAYKDGEKINIVATATNGENVIDELYSAEQLPGVIGKDLAEKIVGDTNKAPDVQLAINQTGWKLDADGGVTFPDGSQAGFGSREAAEQRVIREANLEKGASDTLVPTYQYSGGDLRVGGEGMVGFYDRMLPKEVGKYVKKFGSKVEKSPLEGLAEMETAKAIEETEKLMEAAPRIYKKESEVQRMQSTGELILKSLNQGQSMQTARRRAESWDKEMADSYMAVLDANRATGPSGSQIWKVDITDKMRETVGTEGQALFSPESNRFQDATENALKGLPPIYAQVFQASQKGQTPPSPTDLARQFGIPEKAVQNIVSTVRSRIQAFGRTTSDQGLAPNTDSEGNLDGGRPDLGLSTVPAVAAVDQIRNQEGLSNNRNREEIRRDAAKLMTQPSAIQNLIQSFRDGEPNATETAAANMILTEAGISGNQSIEITELAMAYREAGSRWAETGQARVDVHRSPAERNALFLSRALNTPNKDAKRSYDQAKTPEEKAAVLEAWNAKVKGIKEALKSRGVDLDAAMEHLNAHRNLIKQAEAEATESHSKLVERLEARVAQLEGELTQAQGEAAQTAKQAEIDKAKQDSQRAKELDPAQSVQLELAKLPEAKRTALEAIRDGATWEQAAIMTGMGLRELKITFNQFTEALDTAGAQAIMLAEDIMLGRTLQSPAGDGISRMDQAKKAAAGIRKALGWDANVINRRSKGEKSTSRPTKKQKAESPMMSDAQFEDYINNPQSWRPLWQWEMAVTGENISFDQWINKPETRARQTRLMKMSTEPVSTTTGELNMNDPISVKRAFEALDMHDSTLWDKALSFWRMSILSGPQTAIVNFGGNIAHSMYQLGPRRILEAGVNDVLGIIGLGSKDAATLKELGYMARHIHTGIKKGADAMVRSWKMDDRIVESEVLALGKQTEFSGIGADYIPKALGGKIGNIMHSISFRHMTAADEMLKSFHGHVEVGARAYRIAKKEGLKGDALDSRIEELMEYGSAAWQQAYESAEWVTFQTPLEKTSRKSISILDRAAAGLRRMSMSDTGRTKEIIDGNGKRRTVKVYKPNAFTFFFPFINTPLNIFKIGIEMSPVGAFFSLIDATRALKERIDKKHISPEAAKLAATEIYDKARLVQDVTNQTVAAGMFWALGSLVRPGDDEEEIPFITGSVDWKRTSSGDRNVRQRVMPAYSIRIGDNIFSYQRVEPFGTALGFLVDMRLAVGKHGGMNDKALGEFMTTAINQLDNKTYMQGISDLMNAIHDPQRFGSRIASSIITGYVPNLIRQPIREADPYVRDTRPQQDEGFVEAVTNRLKYSLAPGYAPIAMDVWGNPRLKNPGKQLGNVHTDTLWRIFDPTNANIGAEALPIDRYIFNWNNSAAEPKERFNIEPIRRDLSMTINGERYRVTVSQEDYEEANRQAGQSALEALGQDWDVGNPSIEGIEQIKESIRIRQRYERDRLRAKYRAIALEQGPS